MLARIILRFPRGSLGFIQECKGDKEAAWNGVMGGQAGEVMVEMMMVQRK